MAEMILFIIRLLLTLLIFTPTLLGVGYLVYKILKKLWTLITRHSHIKAKPSEKQKFWFCNLWLPCITIIPLGLSISFFCGINEKSIRSVWALLLAVYKLGAISVFSYLLGYFIFSHFRHHKCYISKKIVCSWFLFYLIIFIGLVAERALDIPVYYQDDLDPYYSNSYNETMVQ